MDHTVLFRACLQAVAARDKSLSGSLTSAILPRRGAGSAFQRRGAELARTIAQLAGFIQQERDAYLATEFAAVGAASMSDAERDQFDGGAQDIMRTCAHLAREFRAEFAVAEAKDQAALHRRAVADILDAYLKSVCRFYSEMKAIRVQRAVEKRNFSQVMPVRSGKSAYSQKDMSSAAAAARAQPSPPPEELRQHRVSSPTSDWHQVDDDVDADASKLSPEELQMLETENEQMFNELNNMTEEVRQVESKVVKIAQLQEIFTEKVLEQDKDIDRIADLVVGSTENIKDANEQLRSAIKNNAGMRVWVLFFLLVLSFSLLFLDWYND